jgi:protein-S-isoprenylcysteine O-methyltransferase Ste14
MKQWLVFGGIVGYLVVCMGIRTWLHRRATGQSGYLGISAAPGSVAWLGGAGFALGVLFLLVAPLVPFDPVVLPNRASDLFGTACVALGGLGTWWSQSAMGESWRIGVRESESTKLVTAGPYAYVRNPIFTCMLLATLGACVLLPNAIMLVGGALLFVAIELQVRRVEEPYLERVHGDAYRDYARRVGRFLPKLYTA